jgi:opacity protein-like surface antigen
MSVYPRRALLVVALLSLSSARAWAQAPESEPIGPRAGTFELRLDNTWYAGGFPLGNGFAHQAPERGENSNILSFGASLGYFLNDHVELGGGLTYVNLDGDAQVPGLSVFARGFWMVGPSTALYAGGGGLFQVMIPDTGNNQTLYGLGVDAGVEQFLTSNWAIRLGMSHRHIWVHRDVNIPGIDDTTSNDVIGVNWGIAAYF